MMGYLIAVNDLSPNAHIYVNGIELKISSLIISGNDIRDCVSFTSPTIIAAKVGDSYELELEGFKMCNNGKGYYQLTGLRLIHSRARAYEYSQFYESERVKE